MKLLQYTFIAGAAIGALQFADDVAFEAPEWQRFVTQFCPFVVQGAAGSWGLGRANSLILCCSSSRITALESVCLHDAGTHQTPAEASQGSSLHVLNPWSAAAVAKVLQFHLTQRNLLVPWGSWRNLCSKPESTFDKVEDGGGQFSTANWLRPQRPDVFKELRADWAKIILQRRLHIQVESSLRSQLSTPSFSADTIKLFQESLQSWLQRHHMEADWTIPAGQSLRLPLFKQLLQVSYDNDVCLPDLLAQGVPIGVLRQIPSSHQWPPDDRPQGRRQLGQRRELL